MRNMRHLVASLALLGGLVFIAPTANAAVIAPPTKGPICQTTATLLCVHSTDNSHIRNAHKGEKVEFVLQSDGQKYSGLHQVGRHLMRQTLVETLSTGVLYATYVATTVGKVQFEASAAPICTQGQACPQYILLWRVTVNITK